MRVSTRVVRLLLIVSVTTGAAFLAAATPAEAFSDTDLHPYWQAIDQVGSRGIFEGYVDGTFRPRDAILRGQFTKAACRCLGIEPTAETPSTFADVLTNGLGFISAAQNAGMVVGYGDGLFHPYVPVTRQQAIVVLIRGIRGTHPNLLKEPPYRSGFETSSDLGGGEAYTLAEANHLLDELPVFDLGLKGPISRGEAAKLLANVVALVDGTRN